MQWLDDWNHFMQTGAIRDYLSYRNARTHQEAADSADHDKRRRSSDKVGG